MIYRKFKDKELSLLGMGCMRFPCIDGKEGEPDQAAVNVMVDFAMAKGINYYDTAYGYHEGNSQIVIGNALKKYPQNMPVAVWTDPHDGIEIEIKTWTHDNYPYDKPDIDYVAIY